MGGIEKPAPKQPRQPQIGTLREEQSSTAEGAGAEQALGIASPHISPPPLDGLPNHSTNQRLRQAVFLRTQRKLGNRSLQRSLSQPRAVVVQRQDPPSSGTSPASQQAEPRYNLTIGSQALENVTGADVIRALRQHYNWLDARLAGDLEGHRYLKEIRDDQWIVGFFADTLGGVEMPPLDMWSEPRIMMDAARSTLDAGAVETSIHNLERAEEAYNRCHRRLIEYREGTISGAERSVTVLKVTAAAGAVAATVATGGIAAGGAAPMLGISAGTYSAGLLGTSTAVAVAGGAYGATQELAGQAGEIGAGLRQELDIAQILRRGATDAVTNFVGALAGGALSRYITRFFGSYLSNISDDVLIELGEQMGLRGPLPRDFFVTHGQRFVADFLGGVGSSPLTTAVSTVVNRLTGGGPMPDAERFANMVGEEMVRGGIVQVFLGAFMHAYGGLARGQSAAGGRMTTDGEGTTRSATTEGTATPTTRELGGTTTTPDPSTTTTTRPADATTTVRDPNSSTTTPDSTTSTTTTETTTADPATSGAVGADIAPPVEQLLPGRYQPQGEPERGTSDATILLDTSTGQRYLFKPSRGEALVSRARARGIQPGSYAPRAVASETVAGEVGLQAPEIRIVEFEGQRGSLQRWAEEGITLADLSEQNPALYERIMASPEYQRLRADINAFDYLINNLDRNPGNLIIEIGPDGLPRRLIPIDHDLTFPPTAERPILDGWTSGLPERYSHSMYEHLRHMNANRDRLRNALRPFVNDVEIATMFQRLERILGDIETKLAQRGPQGTFFD
jgi:hypothetical protein